MGLMSLIVEGWEMEELGLEILVRMVIALIFGVF